MLHGHCPIVTVNDDLRRFGDKPLVDVTGNKAIQTVNDVAESLIPIYSSTRVDAAACTMRYSERIRRLWLVLA